MIFAAGYGATRNIAIIIAVISTLGFVFYVASNLRKSRPEIGSEIELAPNRKPYFEDDVLEGRKLDRSLWAAFGMLVILAVGLPLYWLHEPGRQAGAVKGLNVTFAKWGSELFAPVAEGGFNCAGCHGTKGIGGVATYTLIDPRTGETRVVTWKAPALNTVLLRFSEDEVRFIITYGRPFSPMSPWGIAGGGPMNDQQIDDLVAYLRSIQLCDPSKDGICDAAQAQVKKAFDTARADPANAGKSDGELLFNLETASGAYGCARCHTKGYSYDDPGPSGGGAMGPNLTGGDTARQFPNQADHEAFVSGGSELGKKYGQQGQGSGRMPGFGKLLTEDQIKSIVEYERGL